MNCNQTIESFSQDHAHKASYPHIANHQAHPLIYANCLMHQEVSDMKT